MCIHGQDATFNQAITCPSACVWPQMFSSQLVWGRFVDELLEYLMMFLWSDLSCAL